MYIHSLTHSCLSETESITTKATMLPESDEARLRSLNGARTRFSLMLAIVAIMAAMNVSAQRIQVVDSDGLGIPLVTILTEDGNMIGTTNLDGVYENLKGASKVTLTHVAFKPQTVTVADLTDGRVTMEDNEYSLAEIVVKPKPYIYIEVFYRVYVYRNDSLCYFLSGIMPNTFDPQKNKLERGSYYLAYAEHCNKMGAGSTWFVRAQHFNAGIASTKDLPYMERKMKDKYFVTATVDNPNHTTYSNPEGIVGQLARSGGQLRMTLDAGKSQMYANKAKGETKLLNKRQEKGYEYQFTTILDDDTEGYAVENYIMDLNHWEYNDKKSHVKFFVENYATDHYYMDKEEWKAKKKSMKEDYGPKMTLDQLDSYSTSRGIPALSSATRQAIGMLKQW